VNSPLCADLIDEYERGRLTTRWKIRRQPGIREHFIGRTFALVIFFSDRFLALQRKKSRTARRTRRFFAICAKLPLDLQMVLCNVMFGSARSLVTSKDSEPGFRWLARITPWK